MAFFVGGFAPMAPLSRNNNRGDGSLLVHQCLLCIVVCTILLGGVAIAKQMELQVRDYFSCI
jgi:hypothetical protein